MPRELKVETLTDINTLMFIAELFTIKCSLADKYMNKMYLKWNIIQF